MRDAHRWEELLPEEFFAEVERAPVVYWSCGAMEEHGLHASLGTDWLQTYEVCLRAVEMTGGIVFPQVPFAPAGIPGMSREELRGKTDELFAPSLWVSRELCVRLYTELMESMADMGFKACVALGGHYPAELLLQAMHEETGGVVRGMKWHAAGTVSLLREEIDALLAEDPHVSGHGGMWETSLICAARPGWTDLSRAERVMDVGFPSQLQKLGAPGLRKIADATPEIGEKLLNFGAEKAARYARELLGG
ncbi:MAG TPA: creatininase family protein [Armatimonadota bacterium]|nr:creatininase family protein [Armatimonadota bacterium]